MPAMQSSSENEYKKSFLNELAQELARLKVFSFTPEEEEEHGEPLLLLLFT